MSVARRAAAFSSRSSSISSAPGSTTSPRSPTGTPRTRRAAAPSRPGRWERPCGCHSTRSPPRPQRRARRGSGGWSGRHGRSARRAPRWSRRDPAVRNAPDDMNTAPRTRRLPLVKVLAAAGALLALVLLGRTAAAYVHDFVAWVEGLGAWGPAVFIAGYVVACVALVPGAILTLAAGVIFGLVKGAAYVFAGAVLGSTAAFLVSRHFARALVEKRVAGLPRFAAIDQAIGREGLKIVLLLRLSPVFPFNLLNYALGLTRVSLRDYLIASVGMIPGTVLYVYYGTALGSVAQIAAGGAAAQGGAGRVALLATGLLATIAVTVVVTRIARQALAKATGEGAGAAGQGAGAAGEVARPGGEGSRTDGASR